MNRIVVIGACDKSDLLIYISKILTACGYRVLLIDATSNQMYQYAVSHISNMKLSEHDGFDIASGVMEEDQYEIYDYVIIDIDDPAQMLNYKEFQSCILVTNYEKRTIVQNQLLIDQFVRTQNNETIEMHKVIYHVDCHMDEVYIDSTLEAFPITWLDQAIIIHHDEYDYAVKLSNQYKSRVNLKGLSRSYKRMLIELLVRVSNLQAKPLRKALKYVIRGKLS